MSSKKKYNIFRTVKFRITLFFVVLFIFSFFLLFYFTYHLLQKKLIKEVDSRLKLSLRRLEDRYLIAGDEKFRTPFKNVPEEIVSKASSIVDDLVLKLVKTEEKFNVKYFVFLGTTDKMIYEIWITEKGVIYEVNGVKLGPRIEFLKNEFQNEAHYLGANRIYFMMISPAGKVLTSSELDSWGRLKNKPFPYNKYGNVESYLLSQVYQHSHIRVLNQLLPDGNILQGGIKLNDEENLLDNITSVFAGILLIAFISSIAFSWLISYLALAGIKRVVTTANDIGKNDDLACRVSEGHEGEEVRELVDSFNQMLSRIESLVMEMKEVSDNIAHDLRTPLTRIRGIVETTVNGKQEVGEYREMCGEIIEESDRLLGIINTMLEIAQSDSGVIELNKENVDINELLSHALALFSPVAKEKYIDLQLNIPEGKFILNCDKTRIQRMFANLIDNAIKYTDKNGTVIISTSKDENHIMVTVQDSGCGISGKDQKMIFDRFYRCDESRSLPGNGLGLSLAAAIAKAHNASISLTSSSEKGSLFSVILNIN